MDSASPIAGRDTRPTRAAAVVRGWRSRVDGVSVRTLLYLVVAVATLPLAGMLWLTSLGVRESVLANVHATAQSLANENATSAFAALDEARRLARQLAARADMRSLDPARCGADLAQLRGLNPQYANLGSVDADGRVVCSVLLPKGAQRPSIGNPSWLEAMRRDKRGTIGNPQRGMYTRDWIAVIGEPIIGADGRLLGAAQVVIRLAAFQVSTITPAPPGSLTAVVNRQGIVVARSADADNWIGHDVSGLPVGSAVVAGRWGSAIIMARDGVERLYGFSPIRGTDWVAIAGVPTAAMYRDIRRLETRNAIGAASVLALGGVLIWLIRRRIAMPLEHLRLTADAVTRGDMDRRALIDGPADTRATAQAFNQMLDRIKAMEAALRAGEARYRQLFECSPDAIRVICEGRIVMLNPAAVAMFGFESAEAALGVDAFQAISAAAEPEVRECFRRAAHQGETIRNPEVALVRRDGRTVYADVTLLPFVFDGRPAVLSVLHDLTERRASEARVARVAELKDALSGTVEAMLRAPDWLTLCREVADIASERGRLYGAQIRLFDPSRQSLVAVAISGGMASSFGPESIPVDSSDYPAAAVFRSGRALVTHDYREADPAIFTAEARRYAESSGVRSGAILPVKAGRRVVAILMALSRETGHFDEEQRQLLEQMADDLGFAYDKLQAERSLAETEERHRKLVEASSNGIVIVDGSRIGFANPAFARMMALGCAQEAIGMDLLECVAPGSRDAAHDAFNRLGRGETDAIRLDTLTLATREGAIRTAAVASAAIQLGGRRLVQVELRDVTVERHALAEAEALAKTLEERVAQRTAALSEANQDLESFAYSVAHDLRGPLRAMSSYARLLQLEIEEGNTAGVGEHADRIVVSAQRMSLLIDGLLRLARVSRDALMPEPVDFSALVEEILAEADARAKARVDLGALPVMRVDGTLMRQVWTNLISNALKFSARAERPVLGVDCVRSGDTIAFRVRDNGAGFDPAEAGRLFGVFERLHHAGEYEGVGIGLAIVRRIVERHGGRVLADAAPGGGATFTVVLPAALEVPAVLEVPDDHRRTAAPAGGAPVAAGTPAV